MRGAVKQAAYFIMIDPRAATVGRYANRGAPRAAYPASPEL
ncbi:MAG: hypothetical protein ACR5LG_14300 [Sodalis sp. (in: enterobacteria)]